MLLQPKPSGSHLTLGITGAGVAGALGDPAAPLLAVGAGIGCGPEVPNPAFGLAAVWLDDAVYGPLSSEQPLAQPVAAEPTNVGENGP
jgi:hypothetical protein